MTDIERAALQQRIAILEKEVAEHRAITARLKADLRTADRNGFLSTTKGLSEREHKICRRSYYAGFKYGAELGANPLIHQPGRLLAAGYNGFICQIEGKLIDGGEL